MNATDLLTLQIEVGANVARDRERRAWVLAGFSDHGFKFGVVLGEAITEALTGRRSAETGNRLAAVQG